MSEIGQVPRIMPMLWFNGDPEQAVELYLSVFRNSRRLEVGPVGPDGKPITITFELEGQKFIALNGGPMYKFNEATSWVVRCDTQEEIDYYWSRLVDGGAESRCGWLKDRFGMSWQVVPALLGEWLKNPGAMQAMLGMKKLDIAALQKAAGA